MNCRVMSSFQVSDKNASLGNTIQYSWNTDFISKDVDYNMLNTEIFSAADVRQGPHSINRFSSFKTHKYPISVQDS